MAETVTERVDTESGSQVSVKQTEESEADADGEMPLTVLFEILRNQRRRMVLRYLAENGGEPVQIGKIAEFIAATENDKPVKQVSSTERKRVYVALYQCHLPKMADTKVINYNQRQGVIELTTAGGRAKRYLGFTSGEDSTPWERYYGALATLTLVAFVSITVGVTPAWASPTVVLAATGIAFVVCSAIHVVSARTRVTDT